MTLTIICAVLLFLSVYNALGLIPVALKIIFYVVMSSLVVFALIEAASKVTLSESLLLVSVLGLLYMAHKDKLKGTPNV